MHILYPLALCPVIHGVVNTRPGNAVYIYYVTALKGFKERIPRASANGRTSDCEHKIPIN